MAPPKTPAAAAIIGTGFMGMAHIDALRREGIPVRGMLGSSPEKSAAAAGRYGLKKAYRDITELLSDPEVSAVHIVTPNRLHAEQVTACLEAGRHVMCEKPLAMNSAESSALVRLAADHPELVTAVNYNIRFYPLCLQMREEVASGRTGNIHHITGSYVQDWLLRPTDYNWRVSAEQGGALRAVADIGSHWLDLAQFVTGRRITSVCAALQTVYPERLRPVGEVQTFSSDADSHADRRAVPVTTDDAGFILLRFDNGAEGCLNVSQVTAGRKNCLRLEIAGTDSSLAWNSESPNELMIGRRDTANQRLIKDPSLLCRSAGAAADYPGGHAEGYPDSFRQCFRAFYRQIAAVEDSETGAAATGPSVTPATFEDAHYELLLCEAVLKSHRQECRVSVG